ncbi:TonB-dependent receptor [Paraglaciecola sp.]|uniref:TonB-dependent receptor n=1 Tax=Paraglaciecola sp. TaxID=1920173 RepID=UPI0030F3BF95
MKKPAHCKRNYLHPLCCAVSMALLGSSTLSISAQTTENNQDELEKIVVTGSYRESLAQAVDLKRMNIAVSDSIVATDIADFPDQNLAEALQRIPGVAIERDKGMGTKVNVRSLGTGYTHTTINNVSTSSGSGGRDVNFDIFASELIQSVTVKKSPLASDEEGGVAGVVAIQTARPFDFSGTKMIASAEGAYNDLSEKTDPRYSFLVSKNANDKWGMLFSYAAEDRTVRTDQADTAEFKTLGSILEDAYDITYENAIDKGMSAGDAVSAAQYAQSIALPGGVSPDALYAENVRDDIMLNKQEKWGATAAFQYRPLADMELSLDLMAGNFYGKEDDYMFGSWSGDATRATNLTIDQNNVVTKGTFDNTQHEFKSYDRYRDEDYRQGSLKLDWAVSGWDVDALIGFSSADRSYQRTQAKWKRYAPITQEYTANGMIRTSDEYDLASDLTGYGFVFMDFDNTKVKDEKVVYQGDLARNIQWDALPALAKIKFGSRYSEKSMTYDHGWTEIKGDTVYQDEGGRQHTSTEWVGTPLPADQAVSVNDLIPGTDYMSQIPGKFNAWQVIPNAWARENYNVDKVSPNYFFNDHYQVDEDVLAVYAMSDFSFEVGSFPVDINAGIRYISTSQTSFGYQNVDGKWSDAPVKFDADYNDVLPSFNLSMSLSDDLLLRFAAARVMSRASLSQLSGKRDISTNNKTIKSGNPQLDPLRANQMDLALEWYFQEGSLIALTAFYKDLESFITEAKTGTTEYQGDTYEVYSYINGEGSKIKGAELVVQFPFSALSENLEGFGINANYTYVNSSDGNISDIGLEVPMYGLSEDSYNATLYYENTGFDARISYNYKGESVQSLEDNLYPVYRKGYGQFDLSAGYEINDNIKVTAKVINLTDETISEYQVDPAYPMLLQVSGRRISLGVRASF